MIRPVHCRESLKIRDSLIKSYCRRILRLYHGVRTAWSRRIGNHLVGAQHNMDSMCVDCQHQGCGALFYYGLEVDDICRVFNSHCKNVTVWWSRRYGTLKTCSANARHGATNDGVLIGVKFRGLVFIVGIILVTTIKVHVTSTTIVTIVN